MALSLSQNDALRRLAKPGMSVASMGYPDIITDVGEMPGLAYRADSEAICKRHGLKLRPIPDAESYFSLLGCDLHVYDIVQERGCERICDLNEKGNLDYAKGFYDIVLDVGTAEHVINVWQALVNMASMVKVGGHILHENPHSGWTNHGFFSLHPTLFYDFYTSNGFEIVNLNLTTRNGDQYECHPTKRMKLGELRDVNIFCMAKRKEDVPFSFPKQSKYA